MMREIDLIHYLPLFVAEYKEIQRIMDAENPEFQSLADESEVIKDNQFITTCNEAGIARFEKILKITPSAKDTLESRVSRVLIRWNDEVPYSWRVFLQKLRFLCGDDMELNPDWDHYLLGLSTHLDLYGQVEELENILGYMLPSNIEVAARNTLEYAMDGFLYLASGIAYCSIFQLTDSFDVDWALNADAGATATGAGTCEIMVTDSFQGETFGSEAESGAFVQSDFAERIEATDTYTEII